MTAIATTTARQVNITSRPIRSSNPPSTPRRPRTVMRMSPVATGGSTRGSDTRVSSTA